MKISLRALSAILLACLLALPAAGLAQSADSAAAYRLTWTAPDDGGLAELRLDGAAGSDAFVSGENATSLFYQFLLSIAGQDIALDGKWGTQSGGALAAAREAQGLPAPLGGEFFQSRRQVKIKDMVVHVNHWFFSCCSINFSISSRYCAASTKS